MIAAAALPGADLDSFMVLAEWLAWLKASYAEATVRSYWGTAGRFFFDCPKPLGAITEYDVATWLERYAYRSSARRTGYQGLKCLFQWLEQRGVVLVNPVAGIRVPTVEEKVPRALTADEYARVLAAAQARSPKRGFTVEVYYYTGARLSEGLGLRWDDIGEEALILRKTKNGHERSIPLTPGLVRALDGLHGFFGYQPRVIPRSGQTVWKWFREAGRTAGVARVHPHLLRSTAATHMLKKGGRPHAVREVLGHASIRTTQRYWSIEKEDVQYALSLLDVSVQADTIGT